LHNANDAKTFLKHFSDCLFYFCSTSADSIMQQCGFMVFQMELASYGKVLEDAYVNSKKETAIYNRMWLDSPWAGFFDRSDPMKLPSTGVSNDTLLHIATVFSSEPGKEMTLHSGECKDRF